MSRTFNGSTDKGVISSALLTSLASTAQFYISVWCNSTSLTALQFALSICSTSDNNPLIAIGLDGTAVGDKMYALIRDGTMSGSEATMFPTNGYSANTWHHLGVFNTAVNARSSTLDTNFSGGVGSSVSESAAFSPNTTAVGVLKRTTESGFFNGKIARITIWRAASTADLPTADDRRNLYSGADPTLIKNSAIVYHWDDDLADVIGSQAWTFTGTATDSSNPTSSTDPVTGASLLSWEVPAGGSGSLGFTNTGLGYDVTNNEVLVGDYTNTRIVRCSQIGAYIGEIVLGGSPPASSVQGVAWDSSDGTYWVCHYGVTNGTIRHYNSSGTLLDTFSPGIGNEGPNGCAYDAVNDRILAVWGNGVVRGYHCADGSLDETITLELFAGQLADGLAIDPSNSNVLWVTVDTSTSDDYVKRFSRTTGALVWTYSTPVFDVEGIVFIGNSLWMCADQGFHSSVPNGNRVHRMGLSAFSIAAPRAPVLQSVRRASVF